MSGRDWASGWRARTVGLGQEVPLLDGRLVPYINLDNAASTPPLRDVARCGPALPAVLLERPSGSRLQVTSQHRRLSRRARDARALRWSRDDDQYRCLREEHDGSHQQARLPLSARAAQRRSLDGDGAPLERFALARSRTRWFAPRSPLKGASTKTTWTACSRPYGDRIALMTVSGASNVTGFVQPIHRLARKAHAVGADILVDAAQLAPHRRIDMKPDDDPEHLDFVALSATRCTRPSARACWLAVETSSCRAPGVPGRRNGGYRDAR